MRFSDKAKPSVMLYSWNASKINYSERLKTKGCSKINQGHSKKKKIEDLILLSDEVEFRSKSIKWDKERHIILLKTTICKL